MKVRSLLAIKKLAEELQLGEDVRFLGLRLDVDKILACHDIFVLTSNWEGLPLSILEAMQQGAAGNRLGRWRGKRACVRWRNWIFNSFRQSEVSGRPASPTAR